MIRYLVILVGLLALWGCSEAPEQSATKPQYRIAWSHYTAWEIIPYMESSGILAKWEEKYGVDIEFVLINDYVESISSYTSGNFDGVFSTNMDAFTIPGAGGVQSEVVLLTSSSNGNDAIITRGYPDVASLRGKPINLVQYSVSHYLLTRALAINGMQESDVVVGNTNESDVDTLFIANSDDVAVVTWNPILSSVKSQPNTQVIFDSSDIPGEIVELLLVKQSLPDPLKQALTGAWYETMGLLAEDTDKRQVLLQAMATSSGTTTANIEQQLATTTLFTNAKEALQFLSAATFADTTQQVYQFCVDHDLFGSADAGIGISLPETAKTIGIADNPVIVFSDRYLQQLANSVQ